MALDFPTSPALNEIYTYGGRSWQWNGVAWDLYNAGIGNYVNTFNGLTGAVGITAGNQISLTQNGNIFSINVIEGSTSGLDADTLRGVSGQRFIENLQTGILYGGLISVNAGNSAYVDITAGKGIIVTPGASLTAMPIPVVTNVSWRSSN